jgi:hypothetical protein
MAAIKVARPEGVSREAMGKIYSPRGHFSEARASLGVRLVHVVEERRTGDEFKEHGGAEQVCNSEPDQGTTPQRLRTVAAVR